MTRLRDLFDESVGTAPPSSLRADAIYAAGRRRRTLAGAGRTSSVVLTVLALAGGTTYATTRFVSGPYTDAGAGTSTFASDVTVDGAHIYALRNVCHTERPSPSPSQSAEFAAYRVCRVDVVGSDDEGRTWSVRTRGIDEHSWLGSPAPGVLVTGPDPYHMEEMYPGWRTSVDGGRSWRAVTVTRTAVPRVPTGGFGIVSVDANGEHRKLVAVDARTGRAAPLANPPPLAVVQVNSKPDRGILVASTNDPTHIFFNPREPLRFAVSRDNGASWSAVRTVPRPNATWAELGSDLGWIETDDGTNLYVVNATTTRHVLEVLVSRNGGATWDRTTVRGETAYGYLTADGVHVLVAVNERSTTLVGGTTLLAGRPTGRPSYEPATRVRGLPSGAGVHMFVSSRGNVAQVPANIVDPEPPRDYYRSADGWNWERVTVR